MNTRTMLSLSLFASLIVMNGASAQDIIRLDDGLGNGLAELEVENEAASASADDKTVYVQSDVCVRFSIIVDTIYDGSGGKARFEGDSNEGGSFDEYRFDAGDWEESITTANSVCPGETVLYNVYATAYNTDHEDVSFDGDQGKVIYVVGV